MSPAEPAEVSRRQANIRYLLNRWDLLGVADIVDDEYDCMVTSLWELLVRNAGPAQVSEYLWYEIENHFGLDPTRVGVDSFANRLVALASAWTVADLSGESAKPPAPGDYEC